MKNVFELANKLGKKMSWCDFSMLKLSVMFATLFLVGFFEGFRNFILSVNPFIFLVVSLLFSISLIRKMFSK